jgi:hypothetical protein
MYAVIISLEGDWTYLTYDTFHVKTWDNYMDADKVADSWRLPKKYDRVRVVPYQ